MAYRATFIYDRALLSNAVFHFCRRALGVRFVVAFSITVLAWGSTLISGGTSWVSGFCAAAVLMAAVFSVAIYVIHYRNALAKLAQMGEPRALFIADTESFSMSSGAGQATLPWSSVTELWAFDTVWLLLFSKAQFVTLPLACMSNDMRAFIAERVKSAGGRIV